MIKNEGINNFIPRERHKIFQGSIIVYIMKQILMQENIKCFPLYSIVAISTSFSFNQIHKS